MHALLSKTVMIGGLGLGLAGCAQLQRGVDFVNAPATQQAILTLRTVSTAFVCDVSAGSSLAKQIEVAVGAHTGITNEIFVTSSLVCQSLQGSLTGETAHNVTAVAAVK